MSCVAETKVLRNSQTEHMCRIEWDEELLRKDALSDAINASHIGPALSMQPLQPGRLICI